MRHGLKKKGQPNRTMRMAGDQSGQGVIEYILVLVVVVGILLGALYQFHGAFRTYVMAFFDGYISCLLEVGELPGTGSLCSAEYPPFDPSKHPKLIGSEGGAGGGSGGSGQKGGSEKEERAKGESVAKSGGGGSGGGRNSDSASSFGGRFGDRSRSRSTAAGRFEGAKSEETFGGNGSSFGAPQSTSVGNYQGNLQSQGGNPERFITSSYDVDEGSGGSRGKARETDTKKKKDEDGGSLRPRRSVESGKRGMASLSSDDEKGFSFSGFIRFLIIGALVLAILIFFGGQLLQIAKSREKGGD